MTEEKWAAIPGFEGKYEASTLGRIRSLRFINGHVNALRKEPLVLRGGPAAGGRRLVHLRRDGKARTYQVAPLILSAFVGPCPSDKHVSAHWDDNAANNRIGNLRWATHKENKADALRNGRIAVGGRAYNADLSDAAALEIRHRLWAGERPSHLALEYGVSRQVITQVGRHRTYRHIENSPPPIGFANRCVAGTLIEVGS